MSQAHKGSRLISKGSLVSADSNTRFLAHYDITENDVLSGISPNQNVSTLREGYFGGGIAVEESTTNLMPSNSKKFEGWVMYSGCAVTITQNQNVPEWQTNEATRIQTSGGNHILKYYSPIVSPSVNGVAYTNQCKIKNIGTNAVVLNNNLGNTVTVNPNESITATISGVGNGTSNLQFRVQAVSVANDLDFMVYQPQAEAKSFPTSFTETTRPSGILSYPADCINPALGTISFWYKPNYPSSAVTGQETSPMLIQVGSYYRNSSFTIWNFMNQLTLYIKGISSGAWTGIINFPQPFVQNKWTMITVSWKDKAWKVYRDGLLLGTVSSTESLGTISSNTMFVGGNGSGVQANGVIDELRVDDIDRTDEEILSWYISGSPFAPRGIYTVAY